MNESFPTDGPGPGGGGLVGPQRDVSRRLIDQLTLESRTSQKNLDATDIDQSNITNRAIANDDSIINNSFRNQGNNSLNFSYNGSLGDGKQLQLSNISEGASDDDEQDPERAGDEGGGGATGSSSEEQETRGGGTDADDTLETSQVRKKRKYLWLALLVWFLLALFIVVPTHILLKWQATDCNNQLDSLVDSKQDAVDALTNQLQAESQRAFQTNLQTLKTLGYSITSQAATESMTTTAAHWPYNNQLKNYFNLVVNQAITTEDKDSTTTLLKAVGFAPILNTPADLVHWESLASFVNNSTSHSVYSLQQQQANNSISTTGSNDTEWNRVPQDGPGPFAPLALWQEVTSASQAQQQQQQPLIHWDLLSQPIMSRQYELLQQRKQQQQPEEPTNYVVSDILEEGALPWTIEGHQSIVSIPVYDILPPSSTTKYHEHRLQQVDNADDDNLDTSILRMRGLLFGVLSWDALWAGLLSSTTNMDMDVVLENDCGSTLAFGNKREEDQIASVLSSDEEDQSLEMLSSSSSSMAWLTTNEEDANTTGCSYRLGVYPPPDDEIGQEEAWLGMENAATWFPIVQTLLFVMAGVGWYLLFSATDKVYDQGVTTPARGEIFSTGTITTNHKHQPIKSKHSENDSQSLDILTMYQSECSVGEFKVREIKPKHKRRSRQGSLLSSGRRRRRDSRKGSIVATLLEAAPESAPTASSSAGGSRKEQLLSFIEEVNKMAINNPISLLNSKPLADIFLDTTILYADIARFTAWSSERDPTEIFRLLETIYQTFNEMAVAEDILTLDAIGDCYVAVAGIAAENQEGHAVKMARFALHTIDAMRRVTSALEIVFGPETSKLSLRVGLHSGYSTLGVLRCAGRSRLQLFGQSVDIAAKMESTGQGGKVHISKDTAQLLDAAGKSSWYVPRDEPISLRASLSQTVGRTYWLQIVENKMDSSARAEAAAGRNKTIAMKSVTDFLSNNGSFVQLLDDDEDDELDSSLARDHRRLVDWNVDQLLKTLKRLMAKRIDLGLPPQSTTDMQCIERLADNSSVMDAVQEVIDLPKYWSADALVDAEDIEIPQDVVSELYELVTIISTLYRKNPFHCFEHASHVVQSVIKLNSRIASQDGLWEDTSGQPYFKENSFSYIASDPLVQFSFIFAALIHDLDHDGVSNDQLVKEGKRIAKVYKNESVAEQNSYDVAIDLLMEPMYVNLRKVIFATDEDMKLFLQLTKQAVIATDVMSQQLRDLRNSRWQKAFCEAIHAEEEEKCLDKEKIQFEFNRKATIFIEHLIQASDVSHTMQHWHIFRKWNEKLFEEMYLAYKSGRSGKDPSEFWYSGEIGFFDFYIIPLAKKLKDCGVFGVYSDEYLKNAQRNRNEWETKGQDIVTKMLKECQRKFQQEEDRKMVIDPLISNPSINNPSRRAA